MIIWQLYDFHLRFPSGGYQYCFHYVQISDMRENDIYVAELWVGKCKLAHPLNTKIGLTFRSGKTIIQSSTAKMIEAGIVTFNTTLQLNIDKSALDTQRCTLTLTYANGTAQGGVAGIVLLTIPQERCLPLKAYKLVQCRDKGAEIELSLKIVSLQDNRSASHKTSSSFCSIMEMNDFDKKVISPPKLFTSSDISERPSQDKLLVPPRAIIRQEREVNPLTISIHSQAIEQDRAITLQNECNCLKRLLRIQIAKNKECSAMIDKLLQVLQSESTCYLSPELSETLLIGQPDHSQTNTRVKSKKPTYQADIEDIQIRNKILCQQNKQLQLIVLRLNEQIEGRRGILECPKDLLDKLANAEKEAREWKCKYESLRAQINNLQKYVLEKVAELQNFKAKTKVEIKAPSLQHFPLHTDQSSKIRAMIDREIEEKKHLMKLCSKNGRGQHEPSKSHLWVKIRSRIDKSFGNLVSKRLNKEIVNFEKRQLLKAIEQCLVRSTKMIQY